MKQIIAAIRGKLLATDRRSEEESALIYAVGDIHGRYDLLVQLLEKIQIDLMKMRSSSWQRYQVSIVFLGDYIDRGHHSKDVIDLLCNIKFAETELIFLKGNHEEVALEFLDTSIKQSRWLRFGGRETLVSYGISSVTENPESEALNDLKLAFAKALPPEHLEFLKDLKSYWIKGKYMFVHAGINPALPIGIQSDAEFLWIREGFLDSVRKLPYIIVHGHTPEKRPIWDGRRIGIDTGAYISHKLTAVKLVKNSVSFLST